MKAFSKIMVSIFCIIGILAIFYFAKAWYFPWMRIEGSIMNPTLVDGDRVTLNKLSSNYKNGDVIAYFSDLSLKKPDVVNLWFRRIIATEGQIVDIDYENNKIYVDDIELAEDYILEENIIKRAGEVEFPFAVPEDSYFVMGDNRNDVRDSRQANIGAIKKERIFSKVNLKSIKHSE